jgi:hypothetical protein
VTGSVSEKIAQNVAQPMFYLYTTFIFVKSCPKLWAACVIFKKTSQRKQLPNRRKFAQSGVDVVITIFCDFRQFSVTKWRFSQKTNVMIKFCIIYLCFGSKTPIFC